MIEEEEEEEEEWNAAVMQCGRYRSLPILGSQSLNEDRLV